MVVLRQAEAGRPAKSLLHWRCRVVITDLSGKFLDQVGGNGPALRDGAFAEAALNRPQGLAYSAARGCLYVADTENNALREVHPLEDFQDVHRRGLHHGCTLVFDGLLPGLQPAETVGSHPSRLLHSEALFQSLLSAGSYQRHRHEMSEPFPAQIDRVSYVEKKVFICLTWGRQVSLREGTVGTLAGSGAKAADDYVGGRKGRAQALNSPWDLALDSEVCGQIQSGPSSPVRAAGLSLRGALACS